MQWTSLDDLARLTDHFARAELALATALSGWARDADDAALAPILAAHAAQHVWHVELWRQRHPVVDGTAAAAVDDDVAGAAVGGSAPDLAAVYDDIVPALIERATVWRRATDAAIDAPTVRVLDLVLADLHAEVDVGRALVGR